MIWKALTLPSIPTLRGSRVRLPISKLLMGNLIRLSRLMLEKSPVSRMRLTTQILRFRNSSRQTKLSRLRFRAWLRNSTLQSRISSLKRLTRPRLLKTSLMQREELLPLSSRFVLFLQVRFQVLMVVLRLQRQLLTNSTRRLSLVSTSRSLTLRSMQRVPRRILMSTRNWPTRLSVISRKLLTISQKVLEILKLNSMKRLERSTRISRTTIFSRLPSTPM